jgi:hypothetical protein
MPKLRPIVLSEQMACRAMGDVLFYGKLPEFSALRNRKHYVDMKHPNQGCSKCKHKRVHNNLFREFVNIAASLNPNACARLRKYFGVQSLMVNHVDPNTNAVKIQIL